MGKRRLWEGPQAATEATPADWFTEKIFLTPSISFEPIPSLIRLLLPSPCNPESQILNHRGPNSRAAFPRPLRVAQSPEAWPHLQGDAWMASLHATLSIPLLHLFVLLGLTSCHLSGSFPDATPQAEKVALTSLSSTSCALELTSSASWRGVISSPQHTQTYRLTGIPSS